MKNFPLIVGSKSIDTGVYGYQLNLEKVIKEPGLMIAYALKKTFLSKVPTKLITLIRNSNANLLYIKKYMKVHGKPRIEENRLEETIYAKYSLASLKDLNEALSSAYIHKNKLYRSEKFGEPAEGLTIQERIDLLREVGKKIIKDKNLFKEISIAEGKPLKVFDWEFSAIKKSFETNLLEWFGSLIEEKGLSTETGKGMIFLLRQPYGVLTIFSPYNAAIGLGLFATISSMLSGNSTIVKPPSQNPCSTIHLGTLFAEVMEEWGVGETFSVVTVPGQKIIDLLIKDERVGGIVFYGRSQIGLQLMAETVKRGKKFLPELAGSDPCIVWRDVDIEKAVKYVAKYRFLGSGQFCMSIKRLILDEYIAEEFIEKLVEEASKYKPGLPSNPETDLAVLPPTVMQRAEKAIRDAVGKGAKILTGGYRINYLGERDEAGMFLAPTVITEIKPEMILAKPETEPFYPILTVQKARKIKEAIELANRSKYGLRASLLSSNEEVQKIFATMIESGGVLINSEDHMYLDVKLPNLGGVKWSGITGAKYFPLEMTTLKYVYVENKELLSLLGAT